MADFTVEHLDDSRLAEAWPVARMAGLHLDSGWWQSDAHELIARGGGILAARAPDGSIHGIAMYEPAAKPRSGRVLAVRELITFELMRGSPCRSALCETLDLLATLLACSGVALPLVAGTPCFARPAPGIGKRAGGRA
jgi:hypothetical protein